LKKSLLVAVLLAGCAATLNAIFEEHRFQLEGLTDEEIPKIMPP